MKTRTTSGTHSGVSYFVRIDYEGKQYKGSSTILFQSHSHIIDWNAPGEVDLLMLGTKCKGNHFFYMDPEIKIVDATKGFIDAVNDIVASGNTERLNQLIAEASLMQRMKPETNPTKEESAEMRAEVDRLIQMFSIVGLASLTGRSSQTINGWKSRGRVSATAAHEICQLEEIKALGFTREKLRPDVKYWYIDNQKSA